MLGELGLPVRMVRGLSWDEIDSYLYGYQLRRQKEAAPLRTLATQQYNAWFTNTDPKRGPIVRPVSEAEFLPLPLLDGPPPAKPQFSETAEEYRARLAARNQQTLAQRAQPSA